MSMVHRGNREGISLLVALVSISAMVYLGLAVRTTVPQVDHEVLALVRLSEDSWFFPVVVTVNLVAGFPIWDLLVLAVAVAMKLRAMVKEAVFMAATLTTDLIVVGFKVAFDRPRPSERVSDLIPTASFPSGHVARLIVTLGVLAVVVASKQPRLRVPAVVLSSMGIAIVALSRVASGEHWPSDVLGGLLLGIFWLDILLFAWKSLGRV